MSPYPLPPALPLVRQILLPSPHLTTPALLFDVFWNFFWKRDLKRNTVRPWQTAPVDEVQSGREENATEAPALTFRGFSSQWLVFSELFPKICFHYKYYHVCNILTVCFFLKKPHTQHIFQSTKLQPKPTCMYLEVLLLFIN